MSYRQATVTTVPTQIAPWLPRRKSIAIINEGATKAFVSSDQADIVTKGFPLAPGASLSLIAEFGDEPELELFAIVAAGTTDIRITEGTRNVPADETPDGRA